MSTAFKRVWCWSSSTALHRTTLIRIPPLSSQKMPHLRTVLGHCIHLHHCAKESPRETMEIMMMNNQTHSSIKIQLDKGVWLVTKVATTLNTHQTNTTCMGAFQSQTKKTLLLFFLSFFLFSFFFLRLFTVHTQQTDMYTAKNDTCKHD